MQRTNSRIIKLPLIVEASGDLAVGLNRAQIEELNARSNDYGRRTAIPTLDDYVIDPFSTAFKERVFNEAVKVVGLDSNGILNGRHSIEELFNGKKFVASAYPTQTSEYQFVLSLTKDFLDTVIADNTTGVSREGIRKVDEHAYIFIKYILDEMERFRSENSTKFNRKDLSVKDPATDKTFPLDEKIEEMRVYLELQRFAQINPENSDGFHYARSLRTRINSFLSDFERREMEKHGIPTLGLKESQSIDYQLSDESAVRYLFFPKPSTEYGQIYSGLVGRETKNIARSNGDLDIIRELAFKVPYEYIRGGAGVRVITETDKTAKKGKIKILRISKDGVQEERSYSVFNNEGKLYVMVGDVLEALRILTQKHTEVPTQVKIDFFAAPPSYLR